jgi:DNA adenine methylase
VLGEARRRGVKIVATNANHESVRKLYRNEGFALKTVRRFSPISASADSRKQYEEVVILGNIKVASK